MKKGKIIILISVLLGIVGISLAVIFLPKSKPEKPEANVVPASLQITFKTNLSFAVNAPVPTIKDIINEDVKGSMEIYFANQLYEEETLKNLGEYTIKVTVDNKVYEATIKVSDTEKPQLSLKEITITEGEKYAIDAFVTSCTDNYSAKCSFTYLDEAMANYTKVGTYDIFIKAQDESQNEVTEATKLTITKKNTTNNTTSKTKPSSSQNQSSNKTTSSTTPKVTKTGTTSEDVVSTSTKYGVKITTTTTIYYDVYSDGSKKETKRSSKDTYDYSTFNATTAEIMPEAKSEASKYSKEINEVLTYVNKFRQEANVAPLTLNNDLVLAASVRAIEMAWANNFSHTRPDGTSCFTVSSLAFAENIAYGYGTPEKVANGWYNSPGHKANMMNSSYKSIGIGVYKFQGTYF